jgi:hypothetical protein
VAQAIERLGDTDAAPGFLLLQALSQNGWAIDVMAGFAGGIMVRATRPGSHPVERYGESVAAVAPEVVEACTMLGGAHAHRSTRAGAREDVS